MQKHLTKAHHNQIIENRLENKSFVNNQQKNEQSIWWRTKTRTTADFFLRKQFKPKKTEVCNQIESYSQQIFLRNFKFNYINNYIKING